MQIMYMKSSTEIPNQILLRWKTWRWLAFPVSETINLFESKQCVNNYVSDSGTGRPLLFCDQKYNMGAITDLCFSVFSFLCSVLRSLFVLFLLTIVLSVFWFTASDYPCGILKHFKRMMNLLENVINSLLFRS